MEAGTVTGTPDKPYAPVEADESVDQERVDLPEGVPVGASDIDQAPPQQAAQPQAKAEEDVVDILRPKAENKLWAFGPNGEFEFIQRPLSFIGKMQWFSLVGSVLDKSMGGENALSMNSLLSAPQGREGSLTMNDFRDADTFVHAISKLLVEAPDFLIKSYAIWLGVPSHQRPLVEEVLSQPPELGGLTDEQGVEMIEVFIDQNYEALDRFFRDRIGQLGKRIQQRAAAVAESRQSKP